MPARRPIWSASPIGHEDFSRHVDAGGTQCFENEHTPCATPTPLQVHQLGQNRIRHVDTQLGPCAGRARVGGRTSECRSWHLDANQGQGRQHEMADGHVF